MSEHRESGDLAHLRERVAGVIATEFHHTVLMQSDGTVGYAPNTLRLAEAVLDALGLEQPGGIAYCPVHDEPDIEGFDAFGACRSAEDECIEVPLFRLRAAESGRSAEVE